MINRYENKNEKHEKSIRKSNELFEKSIGYSNYSKLIYK